MAARQAKMRRHAAIEIRANRLHLTVLEDAGNDGNWKPRFRMLQWRQSGESLDGELDQRELAAGLSRLIAEEKLAGQPVRLALSGSYCVTRVVTGTAEHVRRELALLEERVPLYVGLGFGEKVVAQCQTALDARHQHALVSIANRKTLQTILSAAATAKLRVDFVEPSQIALVRALSYGKHDQQFPAVLANVTPTSVEVAVSMGGRFLLDYRPAQSGGPAGVASLIASQQKRLQKFFDRHYKLRFGQIRYVFLCGEVAAVAEALPSFGSYDRLDATVLVPGLINEHWGASLANAQSLHLDADACASLGTCLLALQPEALLSTCNLMEPLTRVQTTSLARIAGRTLWPAAAAAVLAMGTFGVAQYEHRRLGAVQSEISDLEPLRQQVAAAQSLMVAAESKSRHLQELAARVSGRAPAELLTTIAQCLPPEVWLDRLEFAGSGQIRLSGSGYGEEGIYEFVRWLGQAPGIAQVEVEGISGGKSAAGRMSKFEVKFVANELVNSEASDGRTHASDLTDLPGDDQSPQNRHNRIFCAGAVGHLARSR